MTHISLFSINVMDMGKIDLVEESSAKHFIL